MKGPSFVWIPALLLLLEAFGCSSKENIMDRTDLREAITGYLEKTLTVPTSGGEIFCAYEPMEVEQTGDTSTIYLWVVSAEYTFERGELLRHSAISVPVVLRVKSEDREYAFLSLERPASGAGYGQSVREIFPEGCLSKILPQTRGEIDRYDARAVGLMKYVERRARTHFEPE